MSETTRFEESARVGCSHDRSLSIGVRGPSAADTQGLATTLADDSGKVIERVPPST